MELRLGMVRPFVRWLSGLLVSVTLVAAITGVVLLLKPHIPVLGLLVLYLLAVLPVAVVWGARLAVVTSVLSIAVFALLLPPHGSVLVADTRNLALGVFLVTAVLVGELAARSRRARWRRPGCHRSSRLCGGSRRSSPKRMTPSPGWPLGVL